MLWPPPRRLHQPGHAGGVIGTTRMPALAPRVVIAVVASLFIVATCFVLGPLVAPLVLAAWLAHLAHPIFRRLIHLLHGRKTAAAFLTGILIVLAAAPFVIAITALMPAARSLLEQLRAARGGRGILAALVSSGGPTSPSGQSLLTIVREHGESASRAVLAVAGASVDALIGAFVFFVTFFALLVDGTRAFAWLEERSPLEPELLRRFTGAFYQAGRGLLVGTGLTALVQGACATAIFAALGIPRALLLGLLSTIASLIPTTGSTIVWIPVAAGLVISHRPGKALLLTILSLAIVGTIDNVLRPWLAERANVGIPATLVLVGIFGGLAAFGAWGLLLGPLVLRLTAEALVIARERRVFRR